MVRLRAYRVCVGMKFKDLRHIILTFRELQCRVARGVEGLNSLRIPVLGLILLKRCAMASIYGASSPRLKIAIAAVILVIINKHQQQVRAY